MVTTSSNCSRNFSVKVAKLAMKNRPYFLVNSWRNTGSLVWQGEEPASKGRLREDLGSQQVR